MQLDIEARKRIDQRERSVQRKEELLSNPIMTDK